MPSKAIDVESRTRQAGCEDIRARICRLHAPLDPVPRQLAKVSGGEAFFPKEVPDVTNVLQAVSRDIRNQYTIGYVPTNGKRDGTYRNIRVNLSETHANLWTVRTRTGYFAAPPDSALTGSQKAEER